MSASFCQTHSSVCRSVLHCTYVITMRCTVWGGGLRWLLHVMCGRLVLNAGAIICAKQSHISVPHTVYLACTGTPSLQPPHHPAAPHRPGGHNSQASITCPWRPRRRSRGKRAHDPRCGDGGDRCCARVRCVASQVPSVITRHTGVIYPRFGGETEGALSYGVI